jgi:hypothetical protein
MPIPELTPSLLISPEKVCFLILKAREFDAKDIATDIDSGSNAADDHMVAVLEDHCDDPVRQEIASPVSGLNEDEQVDLVALVWLGRGDDVVDNWKLLRDQADHAHNNRTASYLPPSF